LDQHGAKSVNGGLKALALVQRAALRRYLLARGTSPDEADDLLQDLFLKLEEAGVGPVAEPRAYLYRMVENLLLDRRRSAARRHAREEAWTRAHAGDVSEMDAHPTAEESLIARDRLARVSAALAELPERSLYVFRRFRVDGVAQKAIADELGISVSAVEKHLQKAYHVLVETRARLDAESAVPQRPSSRGTT
jgi:RNA polymerase sigma-70 factor (ECF subfamily)